MADPCAFCGGKRVKRWEPDGHECEVCHVATWDGGLLGADKRFQNVSGTAEINAGATSTQKPNKSST